MNIFGRGAKQPSEHIETVLGPSANVRGKLQSDGGVRIDGAFEGVVETAGNLIVGEHARVAAEITARNVTVGGVVKGNIDANGCLEILSTGVVYGDVTVDAVMIDEGGQFHGASRMRSLAHPALAAPEDDELDVDLGESAQVLDIGVADEPLEGTARPADESENGAADAVLDDDFDLEGIQMDIEPVIPDLDRPDVGDAASEAEAETEAGKASTDTTDTKNAKNTKKNTKQRKNASKATSSRSRRTRKGG